MVSEKMSLEQLQKLHIDAYQFGWIFGWIAYAFLLIVTVLHAVQVTTQLAHFELVTVVMVGFLWLFRPYKLGVIQPKR